MRAWIERQGWLRLRHRPLRRRREGDRQGRGRGGAGLGSRTSSPPRQSPRRSPFRRTSPSRISSTRRLPPPRRRRRSGIAKAIERSAREADGRVVAVETTVYVDEEARSALRSSTGLGGSYEATFAYAYVQAIAEENGSKQTGLGFGPGRSPAVLDPEAIGREAAERSVQLLGAEKPASRSCPVVLDPTVAASFAGFVGGVLVRRRRPAGPLAVRRAARRGDRLPRARPHRRRRSTRRGWPPRPIDAEGLPRGRTPLIDGRATGLLPPRLLHGAPRGRRPGIDRQRRALGLPLGALRLDLEPRHRAGLSSLWTSCSPRSATASTSLTWRASTPA